MPTALRFTFHRFFVAEDVVLRPRGLDIRDAGNEFPAGLRRLFVVGFVTLNKPVVIEAACNLWRHGGFDDTDMVLHTETYFDLDAGFNSVSFGVPLPEPLIAGTYILDTIVEGWRSKFPFSVGEP